jgi:DNA-binding NtrC family response regulator
MRDSIFLALNCAARAPTLIERELFGYEKRTFTNAVERHLGCFEQADGGALFVDEITEMAAEVQAKFLRVLEEGQVRRIGATASIPSQSASSLPRATCLLAPSKKENSAGIFFTA